MYKPRYKIWDSNRFPGFREALERIYNNSYNNYVEKHKVLVGNDLDMLNTFMVDLENYYVSIMREGIVTEKNYVNILNQLKSIELIVIPKRRNLYGATLGYQISINPDIDDGLKQLCVSHELGHIINNKWKKETKKLSKQLFNDPSNRELFDRLDIDDYRYILFGFDLLDEVVSQEVAERVNYRVLNKKRPKKEECYNERLFNHNPYLSNYTFYGELYPFAYIFSKKLDYVSSTKNCKEDEYMLRFVRRSFDEDFIKNIKKEIDNSNSKKKEELLTMLVCMGKIKASCYEVVGLNKEKEDIDVNRYVEEFNKIGKRK